LVPFDRSIGVSGLQGGSQIIPSGEYGMANQNSDQSKNDEKQAWIKPQLVDLDKGMDSVQASTGASSDGFTSPTSS